MSAKSLSAKREARAVKLDGFDLLKQKSAAYAESDIIEAKEYASPLVISLPHSGVWVPEISLAHITADRFLLGDTDLFTDRIFGLVSQKASSLVTHVNPYVVNCNRAKRRPNKPVIPRHFLYGQPVLLKPYSKRDEQKIIGAYYDRYHSTLKKLIERARIKWGYCVVIDGHSLAPWGGPGTPDPGEKRADFTIGNFFGKSAAESLSRALVVSLTEAAHRHVWRVKINNPYAGGYITRHYGEPNKNVHVFQIEVNKRLYLAASGARARLKLKADSGGLGADYPATRLKKAQLDRVAQIINHAVGKVLGAARRLYA